MIDIHTHLLPGIDDGPASLDDALNLARACVADGVTHAFATPHVYPGQWDNTRSSVLAHYQRFQAELASQNIGLNLHIAGEVRLNSDVMDLLDAQELPFLGQLDGMNTMLLELPDGGIPVGSDRLVRFLLDHKIRPVLVHPERNKAVMDKPERLRPFIEMGCLVQLTAASVIGEFGSAALRTSQELLELEWVDVVASDTHNLKGRAPRMGAAREALSKQYGASVADTLTWHGPARITGMAVQASPAAA